MPTRANDKRPWVYQTGVWTWSGPFASRKEAVAAATPVTCAGHVLGPACLARWTPQAPPWLDADVIAAALSEAGGNLVENVEVQISLLTEADREALAFVVNAAIAAWAKKPGREWAFATATDFEDLPAGSDGSAAAPAETPACPPSA
jgi:hypothetical protein